MHVLQFYDAHEDLEAESARRASSGGDGAAEPARAPEPSTVDTDAGAGAPKTLTADGDSETLGDETEPSAGEDKYIVKNKDTGEVYDIRDLSNLPSDVYSIFPNDFLPPQEEEAGAEGSVQPPVRTTAQTSYRLSCCITARRS